MLDLALAGTVAASRPGSGRAASPSPLRAYGVRCSGWLGLLFALVCLVVAAAYAAAPVTASAASDEQALSQYDIEAVYLYNFAKFVRWPAGDSQQPIEICVAGGQRVFLNSLRRTIAGETVDGRSIQVRLLDRSEQVSGCEILYLDAGARDSSSLVEAAVGNPVLTVSDAPSFLDHGGMIQFVVLQHRVRFSVNLRPVNRCGLALSSELLKVAVSVKGQPAVGGLR